MKPMNLGSFLMVLSQAPMTSIHDVIEYQEDTQNFIIGVALTPFGDGIGLVLSSGACEMFGLKNPEDSFNLDSMSEEEMREKFEKLYITENRSVAEGVERFQIHILTAEEFSALAPLSVPASVEG